MTQSYLELYDSMVGYAAMRRMQIEVDYLQTLRRKTWNHFVGSLMLNEPLEFGEGDIGLPGGIQIMEPAKLHVLHRESIQRYGGSTSPSMPWPKERESVHTATENERLERLMRKFQKALATVARKTCRKVDLGSMLGSSIKSSRSSRSRNSNGDPAEEDTRSECSSVKSVT